MDQGIPNGGDCQGAAHDTTAGENAVMVAEEDGSEETKEFVFEKAPKEDIIWKEN